MGALFSPPKPKIVMSPPPPPVPTIDQAAQDEQYSRFMRRRRGFAANSRGAPGQVQAYVGNAARSLLGGGP